MLQTSLFKDIKIFFIDIKKIFKSLTINYIYGFLFLNDFIYKNSSVNLFKHHG